MVGMTNHFMVSSGNFIICYDIDGPFSSVIYNLQWLVGGLEMFGTFYLFPYIGNNNPTDELIFFRGIETTNQMMFFFFNSYIRLPDGSAHHRDSMIQPMKNVCGHIFVCLFCHEA